MGFTFMNLETAVRQMVPAPGGIITLQKPHMVPQPIWIDIWAIWVTLKQMIVELLPLNTSMRPLLLNRSMAVVLSFMPVKMILHHNPQELPAHVLPAV